MRATITRTYELPIPSGVKVSYAEGTPGFTISNGLQSVWIQVDFIPELATALKAIRQTKAKVDADYPNGQNDD